MDIFNEWFSYMDVVSKFTYILSGILFVILTTVFLIDERKRKSERPEKGKEGEADGKKSGP